MEIRRTDGESLQAQIIYRAGRDAVARVDVFTRPLPSLLLRHVAQLDGQWRWVVNGDGSPELLQLIDTILAFSLAKQQRSIGCETVTRPP